MKKILSFLVFLAVLLIFGLYAVIAIRPGDSGGACLLEAEEPGVVMTLNSADLSELGRQFDHPFPVLPDAGVYGRVSTQRLEGKNARLLTLDYAQATLSGVWPATAAPLLLVPDLTVISLYTEDRYRFSVLSMPAVYAERDNVRCLYFSDESAAYRLYTETLPREEFLALAQRLRWHQ